LNHTPPDAGIVGCSYNYELNRRINPKRQFLSHVTTAFSERYFPLGARAGAVVLSTALKAGMLQVRFAMMLEYFINKILPTVLWTQSLTEIFVGGKGDRSIGLTMLPPSCVDRLEIWESQPPGPMGLNVPPKGLFYLHFPLHATCPRISSYT